MDVTIYHAFLAHGADTLAIGLGGEVYDIQERSDIGCDGEISIRFGYFVHVRLQS